MNRQALLARMRAAAAPAGYNARRVARAVKLSPRQLQRILRQELSCTPQQWLNQQRIAAAKELLAAGKPVKAVAFELGFKQASHFCCQFKTMTGMTPTDFLSFCFAQSKDPPPGAPVARF